MRYRVSSRLWSPARFRKAVVAAVAAGLGSVFVIGVPASADDEPAVMTGWMGEFAEGDADTHTATLAITTEPAPAEPVTLRVSVEEDVNAADNGGRGHATAGVDFDPVAETDVVYDPDSDIGAATVDVTIHGDKLFEPMETFSVVVDGVAHSVILTDDDMPALTPVGFTKKEGSTVDLSATVNDPVDERTPFYAHVITDQFPGEGPAAKPADIDASRLVEYGSIEPGQNTIDLGSIDLLADKTDEFDEQVMIVVGVGGQDGFGVIGTIQDADDELPPTIVASPPGDMAMREGASYEVPFDLEFGDGNEATKTEKPVSASWTLTPGSATEGDDYQEPATGRVDFDPSGRGTVHFATVDDDDWESAETVSLSLQDPENASGVPDNPVTLTITDDESYVAPEYTITPEVAATEGQEGPARFRVTLAEPSDQDEFFDVYFTDDSTGVGDYSAPMKLKIDAGAEYADVDVLILDDAAYEATETATVKVQLDGEESGQSGALTIADDDDAPELTVSSFDEEEGATEALGATVRNTAQDAIPWTAKVEGISDSPAEAGDFTTDGLTLSGSLLPGDARIDLGNTDLAVDLTDEFAEKVRVTIDLGADGSLGHYSAESTIEDGETELPPNVVVPTEIEAVEGQTTELVADLDFSADGNTAVKTEKPIVLLPDLSSETATEDVDYQGFIFGSRQITFTPPSAQESFGIEVLPDDEAENGETVTVRLSQGGDSANATAITPSNEVTVKLVDPAPPTGFTVTSEVTAVEGQAEPARFTVQLDEAAQVDTYFDVTLTDESTDAGDRTEPPMKLKIDAGRDSGTIDVPILGDSMYEAVEKAGLQVVQDGQEAGQTGTLVITDDDPAPTIALNAVAGAEGGTIDVVATPTGVAQDDMKYSLIPIGDAANGANAAESNDYSASADFAVLPAGSTGPVTLKTISLLDDAIDEPVETLKVTADNVTLEPGTVAPVETRYTITDDPADLPPTVSLGDAVVPENAGFADVPVRLTFTGGNAATSTEQPVSISYQVLPGTANAADYLADGVASLTVPAGRPEDTIRIPVVDDRLREKAEAFQVQVLSVGPTGATIGGDVGAVVILESDLDVKVPSFTVTGDARAPEGGVATFRITLSERAEEDVDFTIGMQPGTATPSGNDEGETDYTDPPRTVRIPQGATSATVDVPIRQDTVWEGDESARLAVEVAPGELGAAGPTQQGQLTIADDETKPVITLSQTSATLTEGDTFELGGTTKGVAQRDLDFDRPVVASSVENTDYDLTDDDITIPGGTPSGTRIKLGTIHFNRDATDEDTETIKISFGGNVLTFQVADDPSDTPPAVTIGDETVGESDGSAEVTVSLVFSGVTKATERTIAVPWATVDGTADAGKDYTKSSGQLKLTSESPTAVIRVPVLADKRDEQNQTFTVRLGAPSPTGVTLAKSEAKVTIVDDDKPSAPTLVAPTSVVGVGRVTLSGVAGANAKVELLTAAGTTGGSFRTVLTAKADDDGVYQFTPNFTLGYRVMARANGLSSPIRTVQVKQDPALVVVSSSKRTVTLSVKGDPDEPDQRVIIQQKVSGEWREADTGELNGAGKFTTTLKSLKSGSTYVYRAVIASTPSLGVLSGASDPVTVKVK
ncbi:hypothetical protein BJY16_000071 [Actinoplanes octamycinicus]|uniref:Fibronectin type-III domain-containing protein n=1 Tax=Actinoplanes octamycinicus TaxID=135948 RepID=A0A7W7GQV0_9ACTN|nr:Calx-beta domain-containing protein [Actinoplanes octamycinicus]MBB4736612.1 hypothetical protein [Actinoplanes octamycinicus]GIE62976.1 hypothetical protein Aoc01nite_83780 [Actinoplanes octamycinicus]